MPVSDIQPQVWRKFRTNIVMAKTHWQFQYTDVILLSKHSFH